MLDQLLGSDKSELVSSMVSRLGLSKEQADGFVTKAISSIQSAMGDGKVDFDKLMKGDLSGLTGAMDLGALSQFFGGDAGKAQMGIGALLEALTKQLSANGIDANALLAQFGGAGGIGGAIDKLAGKLFGKS